MSPLIVLLIWGIFGAIAAAIASSKGRSTVGWFFGGFFLQLLGVIIVACLPNLKEQQEYRDRVDRENRRLREQLKQERVKAESFRQHAYNRLDAHDQHLGLDTRALGGLPAGEAGARLLEAGSVSSRGSSDIEALHSAAGANSSAAGASSAARMWFYKRGDQTIGPISEAELVRMLSSKEINETTWLWTEKLTDWKIANDISALKPFFQVRERE